MRWILLVAMLFFVGCEKKDEIKELKSQIEDLRFEVDTLKESQNLKRENLNNSNSKQVAKLEDKINSLNSEIFNIKNSITSLSKVVEDLNKSIIHIPSSPINCKGHFKPTVFVTRKKANIYNSKGEVVATWDDCTTFTSFIEKDGKLRVTGYFVKGKFRSALDKDWWIDVKDAAKKFKDKNESKNMRNN